LPPGYIYRNVYTFASANSRAEGEKERAASIFWLAVRDERPDLYKGYNPWDRINEPAALAAMLLEGGVQTAKIVAESDVQPLNSPEDFWTIALGSGYRSVIEQLGDASRERVRRATLDSICTQNVRGLETNAIYAISFRFRCNGF
jgi:hypothetical protein